MRRLLTVQITPDFDPVYDIALGPWCFINAEDVYPDWEKLRFSEPFGSENVWVDANLTTQRLANHYVVPWTQRMNQRHQRDYSVRFWKVMLTPWLISMTQITWFYYRHILTFLQDHPNEAFSVDLWDGKAVPPILDFKGLSYLQRRPTFTYWLLSKIIKRLAPTDWRISLAPHAWEQQIPKPPRPPNDRPSLGGRIARHLFRRLPVNSIPGIRFARLPLSAFVALLPRRSPAKSYYELPNSSATAFFPTDFLSVLDEVLAETLPASLDQGFAGLEALALAERYYPRRLLVDTIASQDDALRVVAAMAHERGEKLVTSQHGGWTYAYSRAIGMVAETEYCFHAFLTWGWEAQNDLPGRFTPLPAPALTPLLGRHRAGEKLILVGTHMALYGYKMGTMPRASQMLDYRHAKIRFIAALPDSIRRQLAYRPYLRALQELNDETYVLAAFPDVDIVTGDLNAELRQSRLLVLDHPGTTMPVALAANIPMVGYWASDSFPLSRQAEPFFAALKSQGILHDDPQSAARHVAQIWDDIDGWWKSADVQAARRLWTHEYARTRRLWWWDWLKALYQLSVT